MKIIVSCSPTTFSAIPSLLTDYPCSTALIWQLLSKTNNMLCPKVSFWLSYIIFYYRPADSEAEPTAGIACVDQDSMCSLSLLYFGSKAVWNPLCMSMTTAPLVWWHLWHASAKHEIGRLRWWNPPLEFHYVWNSKDFWAHTGGTIALSSWQITLGDTVGKNVHATFTGQHGTHAYTQAVSDVHVCKGT